MEQTVVGAKRPHFKALLPIIARVTTLLIVTLVIAILVVSTLAKRLGDRPLSDPFTAFANVFPGQSVDTGSLIVQGFSCSVDSLPSPADISERCTQTLSSGMFSAINLTVWDGVVKWLDLKVRDHNLDVGSLSLHWGSPQIRIDGNWVNLSWPKQHITGLGWSPNRRFTYFQALSHITFAI